MKVEPANVPTKMKAVIKLYTFKSTDFKGVVVIRKKLGADADKKI